MPNQREPQLMDRCADYVYELAKIYSSGGTNNRHILEDLRQIDRLRARAAASIDTPVSRPALPRVEDDRRVDDVLRALIELGGKAPYQGRNGIR